MRVGFTGTQRGITQRQGAGIIQVIQEIIRLHPADLGLGEAHHGDCVGADEEFHTIVRWMPETKLWKIAIHPPENASKRAWCQGDHVFPEKPYLVRNEDIVRSVSYVIGAPGESMEVLRSGTWSTIRKARKLKRNLFIVYPSGEIDRFVNNG